MPRILLAALITIAACGGDPAPLATSTVPPLPTPVVATTAPLPTAASSTTATTTTTSTTTTATVPLDPDQAIQLQLLDIYDAAVRFRAEEGRYPSAEELIEAGYSLAEGAGEAAPAVVATGDDDFLVVGSSAGGRGFCIVANGDEVRFGMGIIPQGVDTLRECRAVGSPNGWN